MMYVPTPMLEKYWADRTRDVATARLPCSAVPIHRMRTNVPASTMIRDIVLPATLQAAPRLDLLSRDVRRSSALAGASTAGAPAGDVDANSAEPAGFPRECMARTSGLSAVRPARSMRTGARLGQNRDLYEVLWRLHVRYAHPALGEAALITRHILPGGAERVEHPPKGRLTKRALRTPLRPCDLSQPRQRRPPLQLGFAQQQPMKYFKTCFHAQFIIVSCMILSSCLRRQQPSALTRQDNVRPARYREPIRHRGERAIEGACDQRRSRKSA